MTSDQPKYSPFKNPRMRLGSVATFLGLALAILGADPALFGMDRSSVTGFVQIGVFLVGLSLICLGGYLMLAALWNGDGLSIPADIGMRLVGTGFLICVGAGMADIFGFGSQPWPKIPYFGHLQNLGVQIGMGIIAIGFLMMIPWRKK